jgi:hypothetical protein
MQQFTWVAQQQARDESPNAPPPIKFQPSRRKRLLHTKTPGLGKKLLLLDKLTEAYWLYISAYLEFLSRVRLWGKLHVRKRSDCSFLCALLAEGAGRWKESRCLSAASDGCKSG